MRSAADTACELMAFECISMDQSSVLAYSCVQNAFAEHAVPWSLIQTKVHHPLIRK